MVSSGQLVAVKKMHLGGAEGKAQAEKEIGVMRQLKGETNICQLVAASIQGNQCLMVLELCTGGSLFDLMEEYMTSKLSLKQVLFICKDILRGLVAMHRKGITHRDIKIENILLNEKKFKLCDFGSASSQTVDFKAIRR